jgi:hypothetical protein
MAVVFLDDDFSKIHDLALSVKRKLEASCLLKERMTAKDQAKMLNDMGAIVNILQKCYLAK